MYKYSTPSCSCKFLSDKRTGLIGCFDCQIFVNTIVRVPAVLAGSSIITSKIHACKKVIFLLIELTLFCILVIICRTFYAMTLAKMNIASFYVLQIEQTYIYQNSPSE